MSDRTAIIVAFAVGLVILSIVAISHQHQIDYLREQVERLEDES